MSLRLFLGLGLIGSASLLGSTAVKASELESDRRLSPPREVTGIVTAQMVTVLGKAFYDSFAGVWAEKDENGRFMLFVSERPSARWGGQVSIHYGSKLVFQAFLPPNRSQTAVLAQQAAEEAFSAVIQTQVDQVFGDADLARDEF
ncbi:CsgE family curli-type amyloid fiber assembly protein [Crenobacter cavernae]|uniref:Curli production assembly/transport component CsgE n=1 Tax=Crenobacter cavernae TaxID=2290923 RepID=A0A345Y2Y9_9NEIS|nr:CsgE family curli-type amyloid fiber assembly protein [Crenobacter cavernae]AXK38291.1 hypothetical protein DWG20_01950 [Crenobacter cavernae]